jgi:hypothetical protein
MLFSGTSAKSMRWFRRLDKPKAQSDIPTPDAQHRKSKIAAQAPMMNECRITPSAYPTYQPTKTTDRNVGGLPCLHAFRIPALVIKSSCACRKVRSRDIHGDKR